MTRSRSSCPARRCPRPARSSGPVLTGTSLPSPTQAKSLTRTPARSHRPSVSRSRPNHVLTILLHKHLNPGPGPHVIKVVGSMRGASLPRRSWYGIAGAAFLIASGAIHLDLYLTGYNSIPTIGPLFLLQVISAFLLAIAIPLTGHRLAYASGAAFAIGTLIGYLLSLKVGLFGFTEVRTTAGIVAGIIDVAAFAVLSAGMVSGLRPVRQTLPAIGAASVVALALLGVFVASPKPLPAVNASGSGGSHTLDTKNVGGTELLTNSQGFTLYTF